WEDPDQFTGRNRVTKATLQTLNTSGSLAFAPSEQWSFSAGVSALFAKVELNNIATFVTSGGQPVNVSRQQLKSDFTPDFGWNLAALATPNKQWKVGVTYRSEVKVKVDGAMRRSRRSRPAMPRSTPSSPRTCRRTRRSRPS